MEATSHMLKEVGGIYCIIRKEIGVILTNPEKIKQFYTDQKMQRKQLYCAETTCVHPRDTYYADYLQ